MLDEQLIRSALLKASGGKLRWVRDTVKVYRHHSKLESDPHHASKAETARSLLRLYVDCDYMVRMRFRLPG